MSVPKQKLFTLQLSFPPGFEGPQQGPANAVRFAQMTSSMGEQSWMEPILLDSDPRRPRLDQEPDEVDNSTEFSDVSTAFKGMRFDPG